MSTRSTEPDEGPDEETEKKMRLSFPSVWTLIKMQDHPTIPFNRLLPYRPFS